MLFLDGSSAVRILFENCRRRRMWRQSNNRRES